MWSRTRARAARRAGRARHSRPILGGNTGGSGARARRNGLHTLTYATRSIHRALEIGDAVACIDYIYR